MLPWRTLSGLVLGASACHPEGEERAGGEEGEEEGEGEEEALSHALTNVIKFCERCVAVYIQQPEHAECVCVCFVDSLK